MTPAVLDGRRPFGERAAPGGGRVTLEERLDAALHEARTTAAPSARSARRA